MKKVNDWVSILRVNKAKRISFFEDLFDRQIKRLEHRGVPENIVKSLNDKKRQVLESVLIHSNQLSLYVDNTTTFAPFFFPVIPKIQMSLHSQMRMIYEFSGKKGSISQDDFRIANTWTSRGTDPYYILGVRQKILKKEIKESDRFDLVANDHVLLLEEVVSLCIHTQVLGRSPILCLSPHSFLDAMISLEEGVPRLSFPKNLNFEKASLFRSLLRV
jgi:hypothetical protein